MTYRSLAKAALALLLFLPACPAAAQQTGTLSLQFGGGLHDADNALTIGDNEAQDALNVRLTPDGLGLQSREGIATVASLTTSTWPVIGSHYFRAAGGSNIRLVAHNTYVAASANGAAFANIVTTGTGSALYWDFSDSQGAAWAASSANTEIFKYDGSVTWYPDLPKGTQVEATPDRLVISGTAANPNRINYSQQGDFTNFTAGNLDSSAFTDDLGIAGDKIVAIKYALGRLIYWTSGGMGACEGSNQFNMVCYDISKTIGTLEPMSVVYANGLVYFRAQDNHFYAYDGQALNKLTREQAVWVAQLQNTTTRTNTQSSQDDFNLGAQNAYATWNTTDTPNSIYPSTWGVTATSADEFDNGTIVNYSTAVTSGDLIFQHTRERCTDGDTTADPTWTSEQLTGTNAGSLFTCSSSSAVMTVGTSIGSAASVVAYTTATAGYGRWTWDLLEGNATNSKRLGMRFLAEGSGSGYSVCYMYHASSFTVTLTSATTQTGCPSLPSQTGGVLGSSTMITTDGWWHFYAVERDQSGNFIVQRDSETLISVASTKYSVSTTFRMWGACSGSSCSTTFSFDNLFSPTTATYQGERFDTTFTTPTWGNVNLSSTVVGGSTLTIQTAVSATSGGGLDLGVNPAAWAFPAQIKSAQKRYVVFIASAQAGAADEPVTISSYTLQAATTGQFYSQCLTGNTVSAFGVLSCAVTTSGGGTATFYGRSGASCPLSASWTATTNNGNFAPSANEAFQWRVDSALLHSTETVRLDQCTLAWTEAAVGATFGTAFDDDIYWSVVYSSGLRQNRVLHYDVLHAAMFPWDLRVSAMSDAGGTLYMGCSDCGKLYQFGGVHNDTGTAISSFYVSKEFALGDLASDKAPMGMSAFLKKQSAGSLSLDYVVDGTTTTTKTLTMTGSRPITVTNFYGSNAMSGKTYRFKLYNSAINLPWEAYGIRMDYRVLPWKPN